MSVRRQKRRDGKTGAVVEFWIADVDLQFPDGRRTRVRRVPPVQTRRGAEQYERHLRESLLSGTYGTKEIVKNAPTVEDFSNLFMSTYAETNNKPSEVQSKRTIFATHLVPAFGRVRLDRIGQQEIELYKTGKLKDGLSPKSINNHLTVLRRMLAIAVEWGKIDHVPPIKWLKVPDPEFDFLDFEEARRLVQSASGEWGTMVLLGVKTGLRQGEILALRWGDVDLVGGRLVVRRSIVRGVVGTPKSGRSREVPLSDEMLKALKAHRHLRGELVFSNGEGRAFTKNECKHPLWGACKRAGLRRIGWHVLRHTFASHLVMRGAPMKAVQELLGHATIDMTMRYAHLSPDARRDAVRLLDDGHPTATPEKMRLTT